MTAISSPIPGISRRVSMTVWALLAVVAIAGAACGSRSDATGSLAPTIGQEVPAPGLPSFTPDPTPVPATATAPPIRDPSSTAPPARAVSADPAATGDTGRAALEYMTELLDHGPRESASEQERMAAEYLHAEFESMGYSTTVQPFTVEELSAELSGLAMRAAGLEDVRVIPLDGSPAGRVSGDLAAIGLGTRGDMPEGGLDGKIALIRRGLITFEEKVSRAHDASAVGAVIYNNEPGNFMGTLIDPGPIPAVAISQEDGERVLAAVGSGDVQASIRVANEARASGNVIAELPGSGEATVILGAHYDTVPGVQGANDNTSGTATLLAIARELAESSFPFTLRFISFGSEEIGLVGSGFYVTSLSESERRDIVAMINFDVVGSGTGPRVLGDGELTDMVLESGDTLGIDVRWSPGLQGGSSDHASFLDAGIPAVMLFSDDFSRIHTPEDTFEFIDPSLMESAVRLASDLVNRLASGVLNAPTAVPCPPARTTSNG